MISVFSNYLGSLSASKLVVLTDNSKISDIYDQLRIANNQGAEVILGTTALVVPIGECEDKDEILYEICTNNNLREVIRWINKRITLCIGVETYCTLEVRRRIAMNMLYKLVEEKKVDANIIAKLHSYLYENLWNEINLITNEDLPF